MLRLKDKLYIATFQDDALAVAGEYGLGLELNHTCISEYLDEANRSRLMSSIQRDLDASLPCGSSTLRLSPILHGPFTEIHPAGIDPTARQMGRNRLEQAYDVCHAAAIKKMVVHTGWIPFIYFKEWQAEKSAAFWQEFMSDKPEDFFIFIENVLEDEPFMMRDMMSRIDDPRIKLCLDVGHANAMTAKDISVEMWIEELSPYIGHFHLHNNFGNEDSHGAFDEGSLNMPVLFRTIEKHCMTEDLTFTIEARDCRSCAGWLKDRGFI